VVRLLFMLLPSQCLFCQKSNYYLKLSSVGDPTKWLKALSEFVNYLKFEDFTIVRVPALNLRAIQFSHS
jgi:hypothetical protein